MPKNGEILILNPGEYFQGAVSGAVASLRHEVSEHAQVYLVQLLGHFIKTENFYPIDGEGRQADTLTHQLAAALEEESAEARAKRMRKKLDMIVANDVSAADRGFDAAANEVTLITQDGEEVVPLQSKERVAERILDRVEVLLSARPVASARR